MNRALSAILLLLSCYAVRSQNTYISGHVSGVEGQYVYLTADPLDSAATYRDSAKIKKGMFSLQLSIPPGEGSLYYISSVPMILGEEGRPIPPIEYTHHWQLIYLQPGRVVVNGDVNYLDSAAYAGDAYMQEENDYFVRQRANVEYMKFRNNLDDAYARGENIFASRRLKDDSVAAILLGGYQRTQIAEAWVQAHPNSPYSAVVVFKDINKLFDDRQEEKTRYFRMLTPAAKDNKIGKRLASWLK